MSYGAVKQCIRKVFFRCSIAKWKKRQKDVSPFSTHQIRPWLRYKMAVLWLTWAHVSPKTAILYLNHGRIWWVESGETSFFLFWNWAMAKNLSNALFYSTKGHDAASLKRFENLRFLKCFDKFQIWKNKSAKIRLFPGINYFASLRLVNVRDNQTSRENFENCFRIPLINWNFSKKAKFWKSGKHSWF